MRRAPEPRGTLKPLCNIIPDGTITDYTLTTISIDTQNRTNTRIRKSDLAIATETYQKPTQPPENKPRLIHFVACKTVREYNRNREKIRKFCLEEKKQLQCEAQLTGTQQFMEQNIPGTPSECTRSTRRRTQRGQPGTSYMESNQPLQHQAGPSTKKLNRNSQKLRSERQRKVLSPSKKTMRPTKNKTSAFEQKAKEAAIAQTRLTLARKRLQQPAQKQHSLIHMDLSSLSNSKTIEIINLASHSSTPSLKHIVTSSSSNDFMTKIPKKKHRQRGRPNQSEQPSTGGTNHKGHRHRHRLRKHHNNKESRPTKGLHTGQQHHTAEPHNATTTTLINTNPTGIPPAPPNCRTRFNLRHRKRTTNKHNHNLEHTTNSRQRNQHYPSKQDLGTKTNRIPQYRGHGGT